MTKTGLGTNGLQILGKDSIQLVGTKAPESRQSFSLDTQTQCGAE